MTHASTRDPRSPDSTSAPSSPSRRCASTPKAPPDGPRAPLYNWNVTERKITHRRKKNIPVDRTSKHLQPGFPAFFEVFLKPLGQVTAGDAAQDVQWVVCWMVRGVSQRLGAAWTERERETGACVFIKYIMIIEANTFLSTLQWYTVVFTVNVKRILLYYNLLGILITVLL